MTTTVTTTAPYDCNAGLDAWETEWALGKKTWCCQVQGRACDAFNCVPSAKNPITGWPLSKSRWCCKHHSVSCPVSTSRPPLPSEYGGLGGNDLNCMLDLQVAAQMWSPQKKIICCVREGKGCPELHDLDAKSQPVGFADATLRGAYLLEAQQQAATYRWLHSLSQIFAVACLLVAGTLVAKLGYKVCLCRHRGFRAQGESYEFILPVAAVS